MLKSLPVAHAIAPKCAQAEAVRSRRTPGGTMHRRKDPAMKMRLLTLVVAAGLAGCAVGPDYVRPTVETPTAWRIDYPKAADVANRFLPVRLAARERRGQAAPPAAHGAVVRADRHRPHRRIVAHAGEQFVEDRHEWLLPAVYPSRPEPPLPRSLGTGVAVMLTHRLYARPFALSRAHRRCLWCGGPAGDGPGVDLDEPLDALWQQAKDSGHARFLAAHGKLGAFGVELLHGQMKSEEKDAVMKRFLEKRARVLVATTVVEVATATISVINREGEIGHASRSAAQRAWHSAVVSAFSPAASAARRRARSRASDVRAVSRAALSSANTTLMSPWIPQSVGKFLPISQGSSSICTTAVCASEGALASRKAVANSEQPMPMSTSVSLSTSSADRDVGSRSPRYCGWSAGKFTSAIQFW